MHTPEDLNRRAAHSLPGLLGIVVTHVSSAELTAELQIGHSHMAPNGYLHAGTVVTLADTCAGHGCAENLPHGAVDFTTIELKSNHLGTAREGIIECSASAAHLGKTTQVWDARVTHQKSGKVIAIFRCTQLILYGKPTDKIG